MTAMAAILECPTPGREPLAEELARRVSAATVIRRDEPLAKRTTLRVGGPADVYVEPASEADLAAVLKFCAERGVKFVCAGPRLESARARRRVSRRGDLSGASGFQRAWRSLATGLRCGAGAKLKQVAVEAKRAGLSGRGISGRHSGQRRRARCG